MIPAILTGRTRVPPPDTPLIQRWSTADVPPAQRVDYFVAALSEAIVPFSVDTEDRESFEAQMSFAQLDAISLCKARGSAHHSIRGLSEFSRTRDHQYHLLMTFDSSWTAEHRGVVQLMPGDIFVHDSTLPVAMESRGMFDAINVVVSSDWLRRWIPNPSVLVGRRITGQSPWGHALSSYLRQLSPDLVAAPPLPPSVLADQVGSLLALTASGLRGGERVINNRATRSLHDQIVDLILQRCSERELTAADVASFLHISLRTLHRTLAGAKETFGTRLLDARVATAVRMLDSPLFNRVTSAEIGRRAGFVSASHFARVVRERTGRTPMQLRHRPK